jgi:hypothetical protein
MKAPLERRGPKGRPVQVENHAGRVWEPEELALGEADSEHTPVPAWAHVPGRQAPKVDSDTLLKEGDTDHLRVLTANERKDQLALVAPIVVGVGHEGIAREIEVEDVGPVTPRSDPT